jgi:hypothetical protein
MINLDLSYSTGNNINLILILINNTAVHWRLSMTIGIIVLLSTGLIYNIYDILIIIFIFFL